MRTFILLSVQDNVSGLYGYYFDIARRLFIIWSTICYDEYDMLRTFHKCTVCGSSPTAIANGLKTFESECAICPFQADKILT